MNATVTVCKTYKYRLYRSDKKDRKLRHKIVVAAAVWNHLVALQRRYYRLNGKYFSLTQMNNHVLKLRKTQRFCAWRTLHSQVCQNVCYRIDDAYQRFFKGLSKNRPKFKKASKYASFTFPQSGYRVHKNTVTIDGTTYKFVQHRNMVGNIKTLTVKRDKINRLWLIFTVRETLSIVGTSTGKSGGFDFGLKPFLTDDEGHPMSNMASLVRELRKTRRLRRQLSRKIKGSKRYQYASHALAKHKLDVANKRQDHHFKLANLLCHTYDTLYIEDLNQSNTKALWGRKVSELGFASFESILDWVAFKTGKQVVKIDRYALMTRICDHCGKRHILTLREPATQCNCGHLILRDYASLLNKQPVGASTGYPSGRKPKVTLRNRVNGMSLHL